MAINSLETNIRRAMADLRSIKAAMINNGEEVPTGTPTSEYAPLIEDNTYILTTSDGVEIPAVAVGEEVVFTATENDIRVGTTAATEAGVTTGTKVIPSYHTTEGSRLIPAGSAFTIQFTSDLFDFTKLQAIICPYNTNVAESVAAEKVVIDESVYVVNSTDALAAVTRDGANKVIDLGITNNNDNPYVLRYFTYKEIY